MRLPCRRLTLRAWASGLVTAAFLLTATAWLRTPRAEAQPPEAAPIHNEYEVKAVYLYGFGRMTEWPKTAFADSSAPFVIGILGEDPFGGSLDEIAAKKTIQGRKIVIRHFASLDAYKTPCHILFVSRSIPLEQMKAVTSKMDGIAVFVIADAPGYAERGAVADFYADGERILFEINVDAARRAQLRMDAKLLSLGKLIGAAGGSAAN